MFTYMEAPVTLSFAPHLNDNIRQEVTFSLPSLFSMFLTEDPRKIQDEVMAEITFALNMNHPHPMTHALDTVPVPDKVISSPTSATCELTEVEESFDGEGSPYETLVHTKMGPSDARIRTNSNGDGSTTNDSFVDRLNSSCCSSLGGSSTGTFNSQKYYIGAVSEDECSVQSHVSDFGTEDMSREELIEMVHTLYQELRETDRTLNTERKKRQSREKSLIKLAKELKKRKDVTNDLAVKLEEMQEELQCAQSEKDLLEHRLTLHQQASSEVREAFQRHLDREIQAISEKYEAIISSHDRRLLEINDMHARQCEQLCQEILDANQEVARFQRELAEDVRPHQLFQHVNRRGSRDLLATPSWHTMRSRAIRILVPFFLVLIGVFWVPHFHALDSMNGVIAEIDIPFRELLRPTSEPPQTVPVMDASTKKEHFLARHWNKIIELALE